MHQQSQSVKENSPDVPSVPHETQEEPQVTLLRLPAEGEPCMDVCRNSSKRTYAMKIVSTTKIIQAYMRASTRGVER